MLAMDLSINPNTIQRAYGELERRGYIYTVKGRGNFVSETEGFADEYRSEIFGKLDEVCDSAFKAGVKASELKDRIDERNKAREETVNDKDR